MSQKTITKIKCQNCQNQFDFTVYGSIWGEYPENRELVMSDKIITPTCNKCGWNTRIINSLMYTNVKRDFAVWWEPFPDPSIDSGKQEVINVLGKNSYLVTAPRVKSWIDFKEKIIELEKTHPIRERQQKPNEPQGCASIFVLFFILLNILIYYIT